MDSTTQPLTIRDIIAYGLFWSWNLIFLAFMVLGFAPRLLPNLLVDVRTGLLPVNFLFYGLVLTIIPVIAVILGLTVLRNQPGRLFALGYVVEGPLMLLLAIRFFLIRQATPAFSLTMAVAVLGIITFMWDLLDPKIKRRSRFTRYLHLVGLTLMVLTSLYAALWIAFYALPLAAGGFNWLLHTLGDFPGFLRGLFTTIRDVISEGWALVPLFLLGFILLLYTATLFALAPIAVPVLSARAWWRNLGVQVANYGRILSAVTVLLTVMLTAVLFLVVNRQPQQEAFELLNTPPTSPEAAQDLLKKRESIRTGLLNAYLAPFRYVSSVGEVRHVSDIYHNTFNLTRNDAYRVQQFYEGVARPLLYNPVHHQEFSNLQDNFALQREPREAAQLYQRFFDTPIIEGERQEIVNAVRSTWSAEQAEAAWQAVDDREVHLVRQEVNITENGDWAEIELYEVYQNQTADQQEVIYYFNLPESAVITGLWLGNSSERDERFDYQIAPRGAAQAIYRNETRRNKDPALIEQIGPRQYRLRAFPVPPIRVSWNEDSSRRLVEEAPPLHLWLTYRTLTDGESWPFPHLAEWRNVYWDKSTQRLLNGKPLEVAENAWLPESTPVNQSVEQTVHRVDFADGVSVVAQPISQVSMPTLPDSIRLAVVLDRSYSMNKYSEQIVSALTRLQDFSATTAPIDVYMTASAFRGEPPLIATLEDIDPSDIVYFGGQNAAELLIQYDQLHTGQAYNAIIVLTDGSGYELGDSENEVPIPESPVWILHLDNDIPLGYDDQTLEAIQASGGGVVGELDEALTRLAVTMPNSAGQSPSGVIVHDVLDGYIWTVQRTDKVGKEVPEAIDHTGEVGFGALAARQLILATMQEQRESLDRLQTLDRLHELAEVYGIVTPYSSMIVLVNERQQQILDHLEQGTDRYEREYEEIKDTVPATQSPLTGVPEPEEWLLISLAVAMLLWYANRQRLARIYIRDRSK
jgi:putative PEP-CTERM system integral membrane protein